MLSRLRRFLKSWMEDDWAGAWHASERKPDDAATQGAKPGRDKAVAPNAGGNAEADKSPGDKDRG